MPKMTPKIRTAASFKTDQEKGTMFNNRANGKASNQEELPCKWKGIKPRRTSVPGEMNKLEAKYLREFLEPLKLNGEIVDAVFSPMKLKLAKACFYDFDFLVVFPDRIEIHEVKGHWEDDARVKWKAAAEKFPWFRFVAIQRKKSEWVFEYYD